MLQSVSELKLLFLKLKESTTVRTDREREKFMGEL